MNDYTIQNSLNLNCHFLFFFSACVCVHLLEYAIEFFSIYCLQVPSAANVAKKMKLKFTKAWISFLSLPLPLDVYKEVKTCKST